MKNSWEFGIGWEIKIGGPNPFVPNALLVARLPLLTLIVTVQIETRYLVLRAFAHILSVGFTIAARNREHATTGAVWTKRLSLSKNERVNRKNRTLISARNAAYVENAQVYLRPKHQSQIDSANFSQRRPLRMSSKNNFLISENLNILYDIFES